MAEIIQFMGKPIGYWLELQERAEELGAVDLLAEVAELRAKISYYESRIRQMSDFMQIRLEIRNG